MRRHQYCTPIHEVRSSRDAFTLTELVIVILIAAILTAAAVPRFFDISDDARDSAVRADLIVLRGALEMYAVEHGGSYPAALTALARYTSASGAMASKRTATYRYGKYIESIPPCPVGPNEGARGWGATTNPPKDTVLTKTIGWLYHADSGSVWVNNSKYFSY